MKCPHCGYEHGWNPELMDSVEGEYGKFYEHPVRLERENYHEDRVYLYGCPLCKKTFIY